MIKTTCYKISPHGHVWEHQWKTIYTQEGIVHFFPFKKHGLIVHQQCTKCGCLNERLLPLPCRRCETKLNKILDKRLFKEMKR